MKTFWKGVSDGWLYAFAAYCFVRVVGVGLGFWPATDEAVAMAAFFGAGSAALIVATGRWPS